MNNIVIFVLLALKLITQLKKSIPLELSISTNVTFLQNDNITLQIQHII
jgi:hypothetical protein